MKDIKIIPVNYKNGKAVDYTYELNGKKGNRVAETEDIAMLLALEEKHLGLNSQFASFATKMLNIKSQWN